MDVFDFNFFLMFKIDFLVEINVNGKQVGEKIVHNGF